MQGHACSIRTSHFKLFQYYIQLLSQQNEVFPVGYISQPIDAKSISGLDLL